MDRGAESSNSLQMGEEEVAGQVLDSTWEVTGPATPRQAMPGPLRASSSYRSCFCRLLMICGDPSTRRPLFANL